MSESFWMNKRICVTGGAGFLGHHLIENIKRRGASEIFIPTIDKYDLVKQGDILRMLDDSRPDVIITWLPMSVGSAPTANTRRSSSTIT